MTPYFSICIPAYNAGNFLEATLNSVLCQSFKNFEIIILDNASTDDTQLLLSQYQDHRIRILQNREIVPAYENWTRALQEARGTWVKLLCADDLLKPNALQQIHDDLLGNDEVLIHAGPRDVIDELGQVVKSSKARFESGEILEAKDLVVEILKMGSNPLGEPVCLTWHSSLTDKAGPFSSQWKYFIDLDYWLRLAQFSKIYYTTETIGSFRVSPTSWTSSIGLGSWREARAFFQDRDEFVSYSRIMKIRAVLTAGLRTIVRQVFLSTVLRRKLKSKKL